MATPSSVHGSPSRTPVRLSASSPGGRMRSTGPGGGSGSSGGIRGGVHGRVLTSSSVGETTGTNTTVSESEGDEEFVAMSVLQEKLEEVAMTPAAEKARENVDNVPQYDRYGFSLAVELEESGSVVSASGSGSRLEAQRAMKWVAMLSNWPDFYHSLPASPGPWHSPTSVPISSTHSIHQRTSSSSYSTASPGRQRGASGGVGGVSQGVAGGMLGVERGDVGRRNKPKKAKVLKRRVRKGIPDCVRGRAWALLADVRIERGRYDRLLRSSSKKFETIIERDLDRTFPTNIMFRDSAGSGQKALFNVLKAYACYDRQVGYCQGMSFVVALLLVYMPEEDCFWMLVRLMRSPRYRCAGLYLPGFPQLSECLHVLSSLLSHHLPRLYAHFEAENIHPTMYATQWFITIFVYQFRFPTVLRVWDCWLYEGWRWVYRCALGLLRILEPELLALPFERLLPALQRDMPTRLSGEDMVRAAERMTRISQKEIDGLTAEWRMEHPEEAAAIEAVLDPA